MLRFKRMILNTPLSRIHSASVGLVEVMGTPVGPHVLTAPVTGEPCYYYRVQAWQWVEYRKTTFVEIGARGKLVRAILSGRQHRTNSD